MKEVDRMPINSVRNPLPNPHEGKETITPYSAHKSKKSGWVSLACAVLTQKYTRQLVRKGRWVIFKMGLMVANEREEVQ